VFEELENVFLMAQKSHGDEAGKYRSCGNLKEGGNYLSRDIERMSFFRMMLRLCTPKPLCNLQ